MIAINVAILPTKSGRNSLLNFRKDQILTRTERLSKWAAIGLAAVATWFALAAAAYAEPAIGQFEIKSLDAEPGEIEFQSQNAYSFGQPRLKTGVNDEGDEVGDGNSVVRQRHALELEFGLTKTLKTRIGIEYEKERSEFEAGQPPGTHYDALKLDEIGAEVIWAAFPRHGDGVGLGFVVEYEQPTSGDGPKHLIGGPIFEWASGPWQATFNPLLIQHFGGERNDDGKADEKLDFAYTARVMYEMSRSVSLAVEAYGTIERLGSTGAPSEESEVFGDFNQHRVGPVVYWTMAMEGVARSPFRPASGDDDEDEMPAMTIGLGVFQGLNANTPDTTLKLSFEAFF